MMVSVIAKDKDSWDQFVLDLTVVDDFRKIFGFDDTKNLNLGYSTIKTFEKQRNNIGLNLFFSQSFTNKVDMTQQ